MDINRRTAFTAVFALLALVFLPVAAMASGFEVQVGYADNLRPSPFFPVPWQGGGGVQLFAGVSNGGFFDAGAIRIINNSGSAMNISSLTVDGFGDGASFNIWTGFVGGGYSLNPGMSAIFTQTSGYNFDSSDDEGSNPAAIPVVHVTIDGTTYNLSDTAQVLNTEGTDFLAQHNLNESHQWRDIGTFGGQAGVPEPSSLVLLGTGLIGIGSKAWKRFIG